MIVVASLAAACQIGGRPPARPRATPRVRVGLATLDPALAAPVAEGLSRDPSVAAVVAFEGGDKLPYEERTLCTSDQCPSRHPTVCAWARARGLDYFAVANLSVGERIKTERGQSNDFIRFDAHGGSEGPGTLKSYGAGSALVIEVADTATCKSVPWLTRRLQRATNVPPWKGGGPALVRQELLAAIPTSLADTFPAQTIVDGGGSVRPAWPDGPAPGGLYAVYRGEHYVGVARVEGVGTPDERIVRLSCCFEPRANDLLVRQQRSLLFELAPSFSAATLRWDGTTRVAPGFGFRLRVGPLDRGWQGGATVDLLYASGASATLGSFEVGYHLRPSPAVAVGVVGGVGGGFASTSAADAAGVAQARGAHDMLTAVVTWQPTRDFFLSLDAGFIYSTRYGPTGSATTNTTPAFELRGPLVRLAAGLR